MSKKISLFIFAFAALFMVSCDFNLPTAGSNPSKPGSGSEEDVHNNPLFQSMLGLWGADFQENTQDSTKYTWYYRFNDDMTFEYYFIDTYLYYLTGSFTLKDSTIEMNATRERGYTKQDGIWRIVSMRDSTHSTEIYVDALHIVEASASTLKLANKTRQKEYLFGSVSKLNSRWNNEFDEPAIDVTEQNLAKQWDWISYYNMNNRWWSVKNPAEEGLTLKNGGVVSNAAFIKACMFEKLESIGELEAGEDIIIATSDCGWSFKNNELTLSCQGCTAIIMDNTGKIISQREIRPKNPYKMIYPVYLRTAHYLVLYYKTSDCYYAFHIH